MSTEQSLTDADREFLARPLYGFFTVAEGAVPPQPRPVWFEATAEGTVQIFTGPDTVKVRRLRKDPRASIVIGSPVGEIERWVSVSGRVTIETDGAHELAERLAARYLAHDQKVYQDELSVLLAAEQVRLVIHPEKVSRFLNS